MLRSAGLVLFFDVAGPLVLYLILRAAGASAVTALLSSGALPAAGVIINLVRRHHLDPIGVLVLAGIAVGTILGLTTGDPKLVLMESSVPTALFGLACLGSLLWHRPFLLRVFAEFTGPGSPRSRALLTAYRTRPQVRHSSNVITAVWGSAYLAEAALRVLVVALTSAGTALTISKVMPYVIGALLVFWTVRYGRHVRARAAAAPPTAS